MLLRPICRMSPWSSTKTVSGLDRFLPGSVNSTDPKIDDVEMVDAKISQVVMEGSHQLLAGRSVKPGFVWTSTSAYFLIYEAREDKSEADGPIRKVILWPGS
jgi:hypothetical protein